MKITITQDTISKPSPIQSNMIDEHWRLFVPKSTNLNVLDYKGEIDNHYLIMTKDTYQYTYWYKGHVKIEKTIDLTKEQLKEILIYATPANIDRYYEPLLIAMETFGITDKVSIAGFIAQVAHESGSLKYSEEIASGVTYNNRVDLGNNLGSNFGVKYKG